MLRKGTKKLKLNNLYTHSNTLKQCQKNKNEKFNWWDETVLQLSNIKKERNHLNKSLKQSLD